MRSLKRESTHCTECGVEFDGTNKFYKRALCIECGKESQKKYSEKARKPIEEHRKIKYSDFKIENRSDYYSALLAETKGMERDEHRVWVSNKFNEILQNKKLWEYISTQMPTHKKKSYPKKMLSSSKNLLENF